MVMRVGMRGKREIIWIKERGIKAKGRGSSLNLKRVEKRN